MGVPRSAVAGVTLVVAVALGATGCGRSGRTQASPACFPKHKAASAAGGSAGPATATTGSANTGAAPGWTLPDANQQSTRDVASAINSSNVSTLGVAWGVPVKSLSYSTTPVVVNGVMYTQDMSSNVMAIELDTGKVLWTHDYNSLNGGPDGVNVVNGTVYTATDSTAVALQATTGRQLWSRKLIANDHEGIDSTPGYNNGTVYVSTVPVNPTVGEYLGNARGTLWALNAATGAPEWSWDEVQNLWGKPGINSGGGLWYPPSFDTQGNLYMGIANPGPIAGSSNSYPWGTSRPGPNLYTDSVVKLSPAGRLLWYYQLTPHDLYDWDLQDPPVLTTAGGRAVVIDGGKAGIMIELDARTGKLLWKLPVGVHSGHDNDGLLTEYAKPTSHISLPATFCLEPGAFGGIETQLASNGWTTFAAVNDLPVPVTRARGMGGGESSATFEETLAMGTGEMVAVNQGTGKIEWDTKLPSSPYGAATVTNDVVFTTTYSGDLYAFNAATGAILLKMALPNRTNAPVTIDGDYLITAASVPRSSSQRPLIVAYKLGGAGKLPSVSR